MEGRLPRFRIASYKLLNRFFESNDYKQYHLYRLQFATYVLHVCSKYRLKILGQSTTTYLDSINLIYSMLGYQLVQGDFYVEDIDKDATFKIIKVDGTEVLIPNYELQNTLHNIIFYSKSEIEPVLEKLNLELSISTCIKATSTIKTKI
ncbi:MULTISPECIES: hypothetical protein [Burkholderia]|uniref:hypothetical protein n=1 Tax=Burkholderia TaxID=32008 RepID=UPI00117ED743|nr:MULTISPECIES: hypothetical protein [Burkholderia]